MGDIDSSPSLSLTRDQIIVFSLVAIVFTILITANLGVCWLYRRVRTEDQRQFRRSQKKKMSDVWVYQVHRPSPVSHTTDPPSQQILRKLRNSYDNLRAAVEGAETQGTLGREESQVIEELEVTADLFLHDCSDVSSRRSSVSVYDNNVQVCLHDQVHREDGNFDVHAHSPGKSTSLNEDALPHPISINSASDPVFIHPGSLHVRSEPTFKEPTSLDFGSDSVFKDNFDSLELNHHKTSTLKGDDDVFVDTCRHKDNPTLSLSSDEVNTVNDSATHELRDIQVSTLTSDDMKALGDVQALTSVTLDDFEHVQVHKTDSSQKERRRKSDKKRRGSTYDNLQPPFPVAEFHNDAFDFAETSTSVEVSNDVEL